MIDAFVAVDRSNLVREVRAPVVVATYPAWEVLDLVDPRLVDPEVVRIASELRGHRADIIGWQAGLRRLPRIRATELRRLMEDKAFQIGAMSATLGICPIPLDEGLARTFSPQEQPCRSSTASPSSTPR